MTVKTGKHYGALLVVLALVYPSQPALAISPTRDCQGTISAWKADVSLRNMDFSTCRCPSPTSKPVCPPKSTSRGTVTPPMGGFGSSEDFAMQMFGNLLGNLFQAALAPPSGPSPQELQQAAQQRAMEKARQEVLKKQAMEQWKKLRDEEVDRMAREEAEKKKRGKDLLAEMRGLQGVDEPGLLAGMGRTTGGKLTPFTWDTPQLEAAPMGAGIYDTSGLTSWQRLLCSSYFSTRAMEASRSGDHEGARHMNTQSDRVTAGEMTDVECRMPGLQRLADIQQQNFQQNTRITEMVKLLPVVQEKVKRLQQIEVKLHEAKEGKKEAEARLKEADNKVEEARVQAESAQTPEEKTETDDLLAQALALQAEASGEVEKAKDEEREFTEARENEMTELKGIQETMNTGAADK